MLTVQPEGPGKEKVHFVGDLLHTACHVNNNNNNNPICKAPECQKTYVALVRFPIVEMTFKSHSTSSTITMFKNLSDFPVALDCNSKCILYYF